MKLRLPRPVTPRTVPAKRVIAAQLGRDHARRDVVERNGAVGDLEGAGDPPLRRHALSRR